MIDVLLADLRARTAEIIDYKTDSVFLWQSRLPEYESQLRHYRAAASQILGFPITSATLIFLTPRQEITVHP